MDQPQRSAFDRTAPQQGYEHPLTSPTYQSHDDFTEMAGITHGEAANLLDSTPTVGGSYLQTPISMRMNHTSHTSQDQPTHGAQTSRLSHPQPQPVLLAQATLSRATERSTTQSHLRSSSTLPTQTLPFHFAKLTRLPYTTKPLLSVEAESRMIG